MSRKVRYISLAVMAVSLTLTVVAEVGLLPNLTRWAFVFCVALLVFLINELEGL